KADMNRPLRPTSKGTLRRPTGPVVAAALWVGLCTPLASAAAPWRVSFRHDVVPALTRAGCNAGACHGTPSGKNGFRLSLRGYDPPLDMRFLTHDSEARRLNVLEPDQSLILLKASAQVPHEGGRRFDKSSYLYPHLRP